MSDRPRSNSATYALLVTGYGHAGVASTVGFVRDSEIRLVTDPGMVAHRNLILEPLRGLGFAPADVTDVVFSHHHPDHTLHAALFPEAQFHDHWAIYRGDQWQWRDAEGAEISPSIRLIRTPGHTAEDITTLVGSPDGVVAFTHLWNTSESIGDRHATDLDALHAGRERVLAVADVIVPGHGPAFEPNADTPR
jgi:glyoxylase-like metal-dependent hydrolase (beta-lactamase superfamily II)